MTTIERPKQAKPRRLRTAAVVSLAVTVLAAVVLIQQSWWSRPTAFGGWGNEFDTTLKANQTLNVDMGGTRSGEEVTLRGVRPHLSADSARAQVELIVCQWRDTRFISDLGSLDEYCSSTTPLGEHTAPRTLHDNESIVARITPSAPGKVHLLGADVDYQRGWRHMWQTGTEQIGTEVETTTH